MKWSISVFVALVLATTGGAAVQAADREGMWETSVGTVFQNSTEADFKGGSQAEFDSDTSFKLGFVTGGLGWSWVDTNIATEPPQVGCWWDPWYGYICTSFQDTKTLDGLAYQLGVGARYDFSDTLAVHGSYRINWIDFDQAEGTPDFDGFELRVGWRWDLSRKQSPCTREDASLFSLKVPVDVVAVGRLQTI